MTTAISRLLACCCTAALLATVPLAAPAAAQDGAGTAEPGGGCDHLPPTDLRRICESGWLRVARYDGERPPFFTKRAGGLRSDSRVWVGFDVDLARDIAKRLGVRARHVPATSFDEVVELVAAGEADVGISKLSITLKRSQRVRFTKPYMTVYQTLLINRLSAPKQQDPFEFLNRPSARIGALGGSSYIGYANKEFPSSEVVAYDDFGALLLDVEETRLDAAFVDSARANTWRRENPERLINVRAHIARDRKDQLAVAVNWQDTHLLAWLDLYLDSIRDDGSASALYAKWFHAAPRADAGGGAR